MEFEVKQEYLGHATHLVHLAELWQDVLRRDTFAKGTGSTIARAVDGSLDGHTLSGIAGVANIGTDRNWCGHPFAQANWYAFGRLAWDPYLNADAIAEEWTRMTWGNDPMVVSTILGMMKGSWQAAIDVRGPLGLNFTCGNHHDPGPAKRINDYWQAGTNGIGYNRTDHAEKGWVPPSGSSAGRRGKNSRAASSQGSRNSLGTDAVGQYREPLRSMFNDLHQCPEDYLLWFHLVPWDHKVRSGRTLWEELCFRYDRGYEYARSLEPAWRKLEGRVDAERFVLVSKKLDEQERHAREWRDTCVNFFAKTSGQAVPGLAANRAATP